MAATLSNEEYILGQIEPKTRLGKPARVQKGSVDYVGSDDSIFTVEEDPDDETKFKITGQSLGVGRLDISADANLGDGVKTISTFIAIEVISAEAKGFAVKLSDPLPIDPDLSPAPGEDPA